MFDWIEDFMEMFGCDWDTAAREYHYYMHPETYNAEDYIEGYTDSGSYGGEDYI